MVADRIQHLLMEVLEIFVSAYYATPPERIMFLKQANILIEKLRQYFRICYELGYYSSVKYSELSQKLDEIGNMNGGWIRSLK